MVEDDEIDLSSFQTQRKMDLDDDAVDLQSYQEKTKDEPSWMDTIGDVFTQTGRGALKLFTWPLDVLKMGVIGEGLSDIDELESAFEKAGKPFNRDDYIRAVLESSKFVPTQEAAEDLFKDVTGYSLEPRTELGERANQFSELVSFARGGAFKKLLSAGAGTATTEALKKSGIGEGKSKLIGDVVGISPSAIGKVVNAASKAALQTKNTAQKFGLPFLEFMNKERAPRIKGRLFESTERALKDAFNVSTKEALEKIKDNSLPLKRLRDRGINLDSLATHAYDQTLKIAQQNKKVLNTQDIVKNIDKEISSIRSRAPSPSDAEKTAIKILEEERDILKVSHPTEENLINQFQNYNSNVKSIYAKPEFAGKDEEVRKAYAFLNNQLVETIEKEGNKSTANAFKAANKIYHEKSKLDQSERLLEKAFKGDAYDPKKLNKLINSKQGKFLRRNLGEQGVKDVQEIADYGVKAQEKMAEFLNLRSPSIRNEIASWGRIAPLIFMPHNLSGKLLAFAQPLAQHVQGKLLIRPALRETYKMTLRHAAEGSYNLLKKDFAKLERMISHEWGSVDDFIQSSLPELELAD